MADVELEVDEIVLPTSLSGLARACLLWVAPLEAPFFGARVRCVDAEGVVARLSPRAHLGPEIFSEGVLVRLVHPSFEERFFGFEGRDAADGRPRPRPRSLTGTPSLSIDDLAVRADIAAARAEWLVEAAGIDAVYDEGLATLGERFNALYEAGRRVSRAATAAVLDRLPLKLASLRGAGAIEREELVRLLGVPGVLMTAERGLDELPAFTDLGSGRTPQEWFRFSRHVRHERVRAQEARRSAEGLWISLSRALGGVTVTAVACGRPGGSWRAVWGRLVEGRTLAADNVRGEAAIIDAELLRSLAHAGHTHAKVRTLIGCQAPDGGVCARCYGLDPATGRPPEVGARVGARAARVIAELSERVEEHPIFGVSRPDRAWERTRALESGVIRYVGAEVAAFEIDGRTQLRVVVRGQLELWVGDVLAQEILLPLGTEVFFAEGERVAAGTRLIEVTPQGYELHFADLPAGTETIAELRDPLGAIVDIPYPDVRAVRDDVDLDRLPELELVWTNDDGTPARRTLSLWPRTIVEVRSGDRVRPGTMLAGAERSRDIDRHLPTWFTDDCSA